MKILSLYPSENERKKIILNRISELTELHYVRCETYKKIVSVFGFKLTDFETIEDAPYIPARAFKEYELKSISEEEKFKTMRSSGTSGQNRSKIILNKETASKQSKILAEISSDVIGSKRLPMLIIDAESTIKNRNNFSARAAGVLGFSMFGSKKMFALDDELNIKLEEVIAFIEANSSKPLLIFGFTFIIWKYFVKELIARSIKLNVNNAILIHGGGWKKIQNEAVSSADFNDIVKDYLGVSRVANYYGMVEQTGSIYMECESGHLHTTKYNDIIIRNEQTLEPMANDAIGLVEVVSTIPESYPGHCILTEDLGRVIGVDDCNCGRQGKYFEILGRAEQSEVRGCSDTQE